LARRNFRSRPRRHPPQGYRWFESISLQRRVSCEPDFPCSRCHLILVKNISVIGVVWGAQAERDPALISRNLAELLRWREAGRLEPLVAKVFPLPEAGEALTALLSRRYAGKIVLET
jgi:NADPH:quinone reductase-like Zn-dependent oxidoreductase